MLKRIKYILLLSLTMSPVLTTIACKFNYQSKINEGNSAVLADYVNTTSRITKTIVLNKEKQWEPNQMINDILKRNEGNDTTKNIVYPYFGRLTQQNWNPKYQDFFASNKIADDVIDSSKQYIKPDKGYIKQNEILSQIKTYLALANTLDEKTINVSLGSDIATKSITDFATTQKVNELWNFYQNNNFTTAFTTLVEDIKQHQEWITQSTPYSEVLEWSVKKIKQTLVNIGCKGMDDESFCANYKDPLQLDKNYAALMTEFIKLQLKNLKPLGIETKFNEKIKINFIQGIQKPENIAQLIVPVIILISYLSSIFEQIDIADPNVVWKEENQENLEIPTNITSIINNQLQKPYLGINNVTITKIKPILESLTDFNDNGKGLRKLIVILSGTQQLSSLIDWFSFLGNNIKNLAANYSQILGFTGDTRIFTLLFNVLKGAGVNNSILLTVKRYFNYIPNNFNNMNLNNVVNQLGILINELNTNILTQTNIDRILQAIADKRLISQLYSIIGYDSSTNTIVKNGAVDILIETLAVKDVELLLTLISSNGENGIINRIINDNNAYINANYFNLYDISTYWTTSNSKMIYNKTEDSLQVAYDIKFKEQDKVATYSVIWKTLRYKKESYQNFKILKFEKQK